MWQMQTNKENLKPDICTEQYSGPVDLMETADWT